MREPPAKHDPFAQMRTNQKFNEGYEDLRVVDPLGFPPPLQC